MHKVRKDKKLCTVFSHREERYPSANYKFRAHIHECVSPMTRRKESCARDNDTPLLDCGHLRTLAKLAEKPSWQNPRLLNWSV